MEIDYINLHESNHKAKLAILRSGISVPIWTNNTNSFVIQVTRSYRHLSPMKMGFKKTQFVQTYNPKRFFKLEV